MCESLDTQLDQAAAAIAKAQALLVCAGAGIGVDSGLPDFRGNEGFWKAYPPFARLGLSFIDMASPSWFHRDPELAWGFYGHRLNLYRATVPHDGFTLMRRWGEAKPGGFFVFTSNVDGQFQKAGYPVDLISECHGSIHHLQCFRPCHDGMYPADEDSVIVDVDEETFRASPPLPECPKCGGIARPNVLMFGDWSWFSERSAAQDRRFDAWIHGLGRGRTQAFDRAAPESLVVIEVGAGTAVPTVRITSERMAAMKHGILVRINIREPGVPAGHIGIAAPALEALQAIQQRLS